jgi:hypothetical protein
MRYLAISFSLLLLVACNTSPKQSGKSQTKTPSSELKMTSIDSIQQFLLIAAATDFHNHRPPDPLRFRDVRLGHLTGSNGEKRYILCGQFVHKEERSKSEWTSFVTIKTDPYEQWLGNQAATFCNDSSVIWENVNDLSSLLQNRLDSLRR